MSEESPSPGFYLCYNPADWNGQSRYELAHPKRFPSYSAASQVMNILHLQDRCIIVEILEVH